MKKNAHRTFVGLLGLGLFALPLAGALESNAATQPVAQTKSTAAQRKKVSITVYNQGYGLVREVRDLSLAQGTVSLEFADVASQIQPATVHIRATQDPAALQVLEQNYRYDLLGPTTLLDKYVGRKIKVYRWNEKRGTDEAFDAEVLSVQGNRPVLRINGEITFDFPGRMAFPEVPPNLIAKPTLVWLLDSKKPKQEAEITYLTQGMRWNADYVFVIDENDAKGDLTGWVTLTNNSGTSYDDAQLKLVAGDVNIAPPMDMAMPTGRVATAATASRPQFQEEGFFEYHLYTLERPTTVRDNEQKQVTLLEGRGIKIDKKLVFRGMEYFWQSHIPEPIKNQKVSVFLEVNNAQTNGLGMPLPQGVVRVYKADKSGAKQFVGEDRIDHTPRDEKIRVKMGEAFDVVGERKQTDFDALGTCGSESAWEISLRNHKDTAVEVEDWEPVSGDWEIVSESQKSRKEDAHTFVYTAKIPARGAVKISYRVRVRWC
ncbi:DUF4139 domain-containing protein [Polyangium aurulentum]|uniref:DUF4139 domain-containing protein n=1 Tax=Polyangium aurulentum TaxID=2567896 RepID=UPI0010AED604|nr:DUF4139 domain-containing protein [Polyangium aurulentum]UQA61234.1 DUF4139 domain-containing protein [Polyangium aurulentum]